MVHKLKMGDTPRTTCDNGVYTHVHKAYYLYY